MRLIRLTVALFYDPFWFGNFRRSWKQRRYWLAAPRPLLSPNRTARTFALQIGPLTFKLYAQGPDTTQTALPLGGGPTPWGWGGKNG